MKKPAIILTSLLISFSTLATESFQSTEGKVVGLLDKNQTISFKGVPYAKAPTGSLRFKAPRPAERRIFAYNAKKFGSSCMQIGNVFSVTSPDELGKVIGSEDCLFLNIWKPQKKTTEKRPVFFWIHGGSNDKGTTTDPNYDGAYFASTNDAIYVSVNYRLGHFGAFYHPLLQTDNPLDSSGNFTTLDLIQALNWVKNNAEALGADANNITIAGQSAGCMNVWGLIQSPLAKDLFHKAICSAGLPNTYPTSVGTAKASLVMYKLIEQMGYASDGEEFLKDKSPEWVRKFLQLVPAEMIAKANTGVVPFQHYSDGVVLPSGGWIDLTLGMYNHVPMIVGATKDEFSAVGLLSFSKMDTAELFTHMLNPDMPVRFEDLISISEGQYKLLVNSGSASLHATQDSILNSLRVYNKEIYRYHFNWDRLPAPWDKALGALHGLDAIFYLGNFTTEEKSFANFAWNEENKSSREKLRKEMSVYFKNFIHFGNPNAKLTDDLPKWPTWSLVPFKEKRLFFNETISTSNVD
ncbi:hypothetical protein C0V70_04390 [Bacteriovorax stolpii]|uniref:Uncharacterized protein n=1 Tax=Bacteriovorax stolpii TaxID=960 RepID=A0A2K9NPB4_BACTC|nr:carboxylesterase family protein [Bacteriovorax stolpii]AUN97361.1 hypothetical protein C0V70_04390 [Bacteriovorax stolpii]TDP52532.1 carboxylesterase type B [Bacteriovorax stolpii]